MKRPIITCVLALIPLLTLAQFGVGFHQSNLPFVGLSYEFLGRLKPELRIGTDNTFSNISLEGVLIYDFLNTEDFEFYGGAGVRTNGFAGLVIPVGVNLYPFTNKKMGFHIELAPIIGDSDILRGSWGIRYRFSRE